MGLRLAIMDETGRVHGYLPLRDFQATAPADPVSFEPLEADAALSVGKVETEPVSSTYVPRNQTRAAKERRNARLRTKIVNEFSQGARSVHVTNRPLKPEYTEADIEVMTGELRKIANSLNTWFTTNTDLRLRTKITRSPSAISLTVKLR